MNQVGDENREHLKVEKQDELELSPSNRLLPKDLIAIGISSLALLMSIIGVWFNFFRDVSHLKIVVSQAFGHIEENVLQFAQFDSQAFNAKYSIVFFNDGNKDIVVTSISQALTKVDVQQRHGDFGRGIFGTTTVNAQRMPICDQSSGENGLQEFYIDGQKQSQGAFVVKAGQFYIMSRTTFFPMPIFTNVVAEGTPSTIASCFQIGFVKPDGSAGKNSVLAAQFILTKQPSKKGGEKPVLTLGQSLSVDRIQSVD
jgi:hypothetical protein